MAGQGVRFDEGKLQKSKQETRISTTEMRVSSPKRGSNCQAAPPPGFRYQSAAAIGRRHRRPGFVTKERQQLSGGIAAPPGHVDMKGGMMYTWFEGV